MKSGATVLGAGTNTPAYLKDGTWYLQKGSSMVLDISASDPNSSQVLLDHVTQSVDQYAAGNIVFKDHDNMTPTPKRFIGDEVDINKLTRTEVKSR
jgi:hypothetical protein